MTIKVEKFQIPLPHEKCIAALVQTVILLLNLKEWEIEELEIGETSTLKCSKHGCFISISAKSFGEKETEFSINTAGETNEIIDNALSIIKRSIAYALDEKNSKNIDIAKERVSEQFDSIIRNVLNRNFHQSVEKVIADNEKLIEELKALKEEHENPSHHYLQAINILKHIIPDIDQIESEYWKKIQPLPKYTEDILKGIGAEEELNLALGIGLGNLDTAKAKFILMSLWLVKLIVKENIKWENNEDLENLPRLRPFAREIIDITSKHLQRDNHSLEALRLQKAAYQYLRNYEGVGKAEHDIAKIESLIKAGLLEPKKDIITNHALENKRNDGIDLEESIKGLLQSMGLKAVATKTTGDGGIDIIAYSESPIFSGKYIVQCKDWAGSVGESVIRDLYGVVMSESANKGILVTTGTITKSAQKFAEGKPLELIDGGQLSRLMQQYKNNDNSR